MSKTTQRAKDVYNRVAHALSGKWEPVFPKNGGIILKSWAEKIKIEIFPDGAVKMDADFPDL